MWNCLNLMKDFIQIKLWILYSLLRGSLRFIQTTLESTGHFYYPNSGKQSFNSTLVMTETNINILEKCVLMQGLHFVAVPLAMFKAACLRGAECSSFGFMSVQLLFVWIPTVVHEDLEFSWWLHTLLHLSQENC